MKSQLHVAGTRALLDNTAVDMGDWNCGGDKTNNATWGEGRLDVLAALTKVTPQPARGLLVGHVQSDDLPIANAVITARAPGQPDRFILSDDAGAYQLALPIGTYELEVHAFGYLAPKLEAVAITAARELLTDIALQPAPKLEITGHNNGAGLELDPHGNLWMVAQQLGTVYLVASGVPTFSNVP